MTPRRDINWHHMSAGVSEELAAVRKLLADFEEDLSDDMFAGLTGKRTAQRFDLAQQILRDLQALTEHLHTTSQSQQNATIGFPPPDIFHLERSRVVFCTTRSGSPDTDDLKSMTSVELF